MKKLLIVLWILVLLSSCVRVSSEEAETMPPKGKLPAGYEDTETATFGIIGDITSIEAMEDGILILVEGEVTASSMYDKARVMVTEETVVNVAGQPADMEQLTLSMKVEILFDGPVMESYPVQGTAASLSEAK